MKSKSKTLAITGLLSLSFACLPVAAGELADLDTSKPFNATQLTKQGSKCDSALASVKREIGNNRNIPVTFRWLDIHNDAWQEGRPPGDREIVQVIMDGLRGNRHQVTNVMYSPQLRNALASEIINACSGAIMVQFGPAGSDWIAYHGLVNSTVQPFQCIPPPPRQRAWGFPETWGFIYC